MEQSRYVLCATAAGLRSDDLYVSVQMRLCSTQTNLNGVRVTDGFIKDVVANADRYVGIPLSVDLARIQRGDFGTLGHMYNSRTGEFGTTQIGSFCEFSCQNDEYGTSLFGVARIPKRHVCVCEAMEQLYSKDNLNFSFQVCAGAWTQDQDGTIVIDADPANYLQGMAMVSVPAYPEAKAMQLVAELAGGITMNELETQAVEGEVTQPEIEAVAQVQEVVAEVQEAVVEVAEEQPIEQEQVVAECKEKAETEQEQVEEPCKEETTCAADEQAECKEPQCAECEKQRAEVEPEEQGEDFVAEFKSVIAELTEKVAELQRKVEQMSAAQQVIAEVEDEPEMANPFVDTITLKGTRSLLSEKVERTWTLI